MRCADDYTIYVRSLRAGERMMAGVNHDLAAKTAGRAPGPWRLSRSPALSFAHLYTYLIPLGLPTLTPR